MLELKGLRGEELWRSYGSNVLEFEKIVAPYGKREDWWVQRYKSKIDGDVVQYLELVSKEYADLVEEDYGKYVWFFPRGKKGEICVFVEGDGNAEGVEGIIDSTAQRLREWLEGKDKGG